MFPARTAQLLALLHLLLTSKAAVIPEPSTSLIESFSTVSSESATPTTILESFSTGSSALSTVTLEPVKTLTTFATSPSATVLTTIPVHSTGVITTVVIPAPTGKVLYCYPIQGVSTSVVGPPSAQPSFATGTPSLISPPGFTFTSVSVVTGTITTVVEPTGTAIGFAREDVSASVSTEAPTATAPTQVPTESVPTEAPTESVPTEAPTESVPTEAPTESAVPSQGPITGTVTASFDHPYPVVTPILMECYPVDPYVTSTFVTVGSSAYTGTVDHVTSTFVTVGSSAFPESPSFSFSAPSSISFATPSAGTSTAPSLVTSTAPSTVTFSDFTSATVVSVTTVTFSDFTSATAVSVTTAF